MHDYDFVFTDLKMPAMSGTDVAKSVKHLRPDVDVVVITGYATVESAVECMKHGVVDYIEKPFTEDELRRFVKHALIRRRDRIQKQLKPRVHIMGPNENEAGFGKEFSIPGGVLVSNGHCWVSLADDGIAKIGLDDFAKKLLGSIDSINFPNVGMKVKAGEPLFSVNQQHRRTDFVAPISGKVITVNEKLGRHCAALEQTPYGDNWVCAMEGDDLDDELTRLKIGKSAVGFFQEEIDRFLEAERQVNGPDSGDLSGLFIGAIEQMDDSRWKKTVKEFFGA
jgi:glycine cleavage system H lipoate-binding protein